MKKFSFLFFVLFISICSRAQIGPITGINSLCSGSTTALSDITPGGTWSCASVVAAVGASSGLVTGTAAGIATITYTVGTSYVTRLVTVSPAPSAIYPDGTGGLFCTGYEQYLYNMIGGGTWSSSDTSVATIDGSGIFTGELPGNTIITYSLSPGCTVSRIYTVSPLPAPVTGAHTVCAGSTISLTDASPGGKWSVDYSWYASVGSSSGIVTGLNPGTFHVYYFLPTGCNSIDTITIPTTTAAIIGPAAVCTGTSANYSYISSGGTWSSSSPAVAAIGSSTGIVTGMMAGSATITYTLPACSTYKIKSITVTNTVPPISGSASVCEDVNYLYTNDMAGGFWYSSNPAVTTIDSYSGWMNPYFPGTVTLSYNAGSCGIATLAVTTHSVTPSIFGSTNAICPSGTVTLTDPAPGGIWTSSNPAVATINAITGLVSAVSPGSDTITYTTGTCPAIFGITVEPHSGILLGCNNLGIGDTMDFPMPLYTTWYTSNPAVATVNSTGRVTGISAGTAIITNFSPFVGCIEATKSVTVTPGAHVRPMMDNNILCQGLSLVLHDSVPGGVWSSSLPSVATVTPTGNLTGISFGLAVITYTNGGYECEENFYINGLPVPLTGTTEVCTGDTAILYAYSGGDYWSLTNTAFELNECNETYAWGYGPLPDLIDCGYGPHGGSFKSSDTLVARLFNWSGEYAGLMAGTSVITYTYMNSGCSTDTTVTVNPLSVAPVTGIRMACIGGSTTLSDATPGGTWSSGNTAIATVGSGTGHITGITSGVVSITYSHSGTCGNAIVQVTINPGPTSISGNTGTMCVGTTATLTDSLTGGTWSSSNASVASVGSSTGHVSALSSGIAVITYTQGPCGNYVTTTIHVSTVFPVSGTTNICSGGTTALTDGAGTGIWTSGNVAVASIGSSTGIVSAVSAGTAVITFTSASCSPATVVVTVYPVSPITGPASLCKGLTSLMSDSVAGGTWSSSDTIYATINAISGLATGHNIGSLSIYYTTPAGCIVSNSISVNSQPTPLTVTGGGAYCTGGSGTPIGMSSLEYYTNYQLYRGTTAIGAPLNLTIGSTNFGLFTIPGSYYVLATNTSTGCPGPMSDTVHVSVTTSVTPVTGPSVVCLTAYSYSAWMTDTTAGGTWSSSNPAVAYIGSADGYTYGMTSGVSTISYTTTCGIATKAVTFTPTPPAITGTDIICQGATATLSEIGTGGTWITYYSTASVGSFSGVVTGLAAGTAVISYSFGPYCASTYTITVNPLPGAISGTSLLCSGATIGLTDSSSGGAWSSSVPGVATIGSLTGIVTGIASGTDTIYYTLPTGCHSKIALSVSPPPSAGTISGVSAICVGSAISLTESATGGTWSSSNSSAAVSGGTVSGITAGIDTIGYSVSAACGTSSATHIITINPLPSAGSISGDTTVCATSSITLTDTTAGGTWGSTNSSASDSEGVITGIIAGIDTITYAITNSCGTNITSYTITIIPQPVAGIISGSTDVCIDSEITLTDTLTGGIWSSTSLAASVSPAGIVSGSDAGIALISYSVINECNTAITTWLVTVNPLPVVSPILGTDTVCSGDYILLADSTAGGIWSELNGNTIISPSGMVMGVLTGLDTVSYTVTTAYCGTAVTTLPIYVLPAGTCNTGVAVIDNKGLSGLKIYPNPNDGQFTIIGSLGTNNDVAVTIELLDLLGQVVYSQKTTAVSGKINERFQFAGTLPDGIYQLNLRSAVANLVFHMVLTR